jgi:hypothetical protein
MKRLLLICGLAWLLAGCSMSRSAPDERLNDADPERYVVVTLRNDVAPSIPRAGSTVRGYEPPPSYSLAPATRASARAVATAHDLREVAAWPIGLLGIHCIVYRLPPGADRTATLERLRRDNRVESAQPYQSFSTLTGDATAVTTDDPYRPLQRNLDIMDVTGAHLWSRGEGVRVAIVDTGIDASHPDLAGRVVKQENFVDGGKNARDRHGTAVAGVIAAVENNSQGIVGIAPAARLYAMRACWPAPRDDAHAVCSTLTLAKALAAAIEARMDIVNLSLTGPSDPLLTRLVDVGLRRGVVFVGATPRGGGNVFPTGVPGVISVDAAGANSSADSVLFAPGSEVLTLVPEGRYDFLSGSSLAAASVSGGIALLLARDRNLRADSVRDLLARSSRKGAQQGAASVNLCAAMAALMHQPECKVGATE